MAKPDDWNDLEPNIKKEIAFSLFESSRGKLMIGKALYQTAKRLREQEYPEPSDAGDMEILGEQLFSMGYSVEAYIDNHKTISAPER